MKKIILTILLLSLFFALADSVQAIDTIVKNYPELEGAPKPTEGIPQYIRYIFVFSLGAVGIIAFIAIIMAAFGYVTSVGNPQKAAASKDKIFSALLGMLLLFASYLLLNIINPDLLRFKETIVKVGDKVVIGDTKFEEKEEGKCRYASAFWDKFQINAGESATLTLERVNCTDADKEDYEKHILPKLKQTAVFPAYAGADPACHRIANLAIEKENGNKKWVLEYSFKYKCSDAGKDPGENIACPLSYGGPIICNLLKNKPEILYIAKGEIKNTSPKQYIPKKLTIDVEDELPEAWMCIINTNNAGTKYTGCSVGNEKYLYDSCMDTKDNCEEYCQTRVKEIGQGVTFNKCKQYPSEGLCTKAIGCGNEL